MKTNEQIIEERLRNIENKGWIKELTLPMGALQDIEIEFSKALSMKEQEILKIIESIETEFPDDDGKPFDNSAEAFKEELKSKE